MSPPLTLDTASPVKIRPICGRIIIDFDIERHRAPLEHTIRELCYNIWSCRAPAIDTRFADKASDVVQALEWAGKAVGYLRIFVPSDLDLQACRRGLTLDFRRPGKPTDNAIAESFNG